MTESMQPVETPVQRQERFRHTDLSQPLMQLLFELQLKKPNDPAVDD